MIVVIADDFSGAAEIAGLGLDYGLRTIIFSELNAINQYDLLVIASGTRSMSEKQASQKMEEISNRLKSSNFSWIYKKTDSVMRGYILTELIVLLKNLKKDRALLVFSNPALGRIVKGGKYYVQNKLLEQTDFSKDPEFSNKTSDVLKLLGRSQEFQTCIVKKGETIPEKCIVIGEAMENADIEYWASQITPNIIPAGAAAFFESLLKVKGYKKSSKSENWQLPPGKTALYVLGSSYSNTKEAIQRAVKHGCSVSEMPDALFHSQNYNKDLLNEWIYSILNAYRHNNKVLVAINKPIIYGRQHAKRLRKDMAQVVKKVFAQVPIDELFIEGGATSFSIITALNLKGFIPKRKLAPGVIRMKIQSHPNLSLTIKPGSYSWPDKIWK